MKTTRSLFYILIVLFNTKSLNAQENEEKSTNCLAPKNPENGFFTMSKQQIKEGSEVLPKTSLELTCEKNYNVIGTKTLICLEGGKWDEKIPYCLHGCEKCGNYQECNNESGSYRCECLKGYMERPTLDERIGDGGEPFVCESSGIYHRISWSLISFSLLLFMGVYMC